MLRNLYKTRKKMLSCNNSGFSKDHFRENVRRMRQIQRKSKEKEAESVQPVKALWKSEKYKDVPSKIKDDIDVSTSLIVIHCTFLSFGMTNLCSVWWDLQNTGQQ